MGDGTNDRRTKQKTSYYRGMDGDWLSPTSTRSVALTDSQGATHADSDELSGRELESTTYKGDGTEVDSLDITSYWVSASTATRNRTGLPALAAKTVKEAETYSRQAVTSTVPTTWRVTESNNSYVSDTNSSSFGLLNASYVHTVPANAAYDRCTTYTYAPANTGRNLVGLVASQETVSVTCGGFTEGSIASAPARLQHADRARRRQPACAGTVRYPDLLRRRAVRNHLPAAEPAHRRQRHDGADRLRPHRCRGSYVWQTSKRTTYDTYGRPLTATDGNGNTTTTTYTVNAVGLTTASTVTNAKSQTATTTLAPPAA
ncbi:hypothetical protein ACFQ1I_08355 [Kitasatospora arboriphila]